MRSAFSIAINNGIQQKRPDYQWLNPRPLVCASQLPMNPAVQTDEQARRHRNGAGQERRGRAAPHQVPTEDAKRGDADILGGAKQLDTRLLAEVFRAKIRKRASCGESSQPDVQNANHAENDSK